MNNKKYNRLKQRILITFVPFIVGFCLIIILEIFLVQNGKIPWFIVRKAEQQYMFKTSGAVVSYVYVSQNKKSITPKDITAITELIYKQFPELSEIFNTIPEITFFPYTSRNGPKGVLVVAKLSTMNTHDGISYETARKQWICFVRKQISNILGSEYTNEI